jgi:hypothetical protein
MFAVTLPMSNSECVMAVRQESDESAAIPAQSTALASHRRIHARFRHRRVHARP